MYVCVCTCERHREKERERERERERDSCYVSFTSCSSPKKRKKIMEYEVHKPRLLSLVLFASLITLPKYLRIVRITRKRTPQIQRLFDDYSIELVNQLIK